MAFLSSRAASSKYSEGYLRLLRENLWVQSYRKTKESWQDECEGIWLPDLAHLWRLAALHTLDPDEIFLKQSPDMQEYYVRISDNTVYKGVCPEEAMLRLFIYVSAPTLADSANEKFNK